MIRRSRRTASASARVRENFREYIQEVWDSTTRRHRALLVLAPLISALQIVLAFVAAGLYWSSICDRPLRIFTLLHAFQVIVQAPLAFIAQLRRADNGFRHPSTKWLTIPTLTADVAFLAIHITGNVWVWSPSSMCSVTSPTLWGVAAALIAIGYSRLVIPALWIAGITFCLPCLIAMIAHDSWSGRQNDASAGGSGRNDAMLEDQLELLDKVRVKLDFVVSSRNSITLGDVLPRHGTGDAGAEPLAIVEQMVGTAPTQGPQPSAASQPLQQSWFSRWFRSPSPNLADSSMETLHFASSQDAVCPICLDKYVDDEVIRRLPCNHAFHIDCSDKWLNMNGKCPMCKRLVLKGLGDLGRRRSEINRRRNQRQVSVAAAAGDELETVVVAPQPNLPSAVVPVESTEASPPTI